jgi:4-aminobutyrate aminotransferase/(S)-3-amino-2-methylpropionate transaminase
LTSVGRTTGGVESNEEAIKTAKAYTKRKKILGFHHSYHGQSILMMSLVLNAEEMKAIGPQYSNMIKMSFPSVYNTKFSPKTLLGKFENDLQQKLKNEDVAAFITEPGIITGWGSTYVAPRGFLKIARKLTKKYGTLFIVDEVGTGFSRCGALYGMNLEGVIPDIVTFAKGFSNGAAAIGAMVTTDEISGKTWKESNLQSTFGWLPVSCAAAKKNLELHLRDKVWQKSEEDGMYIRDILDKELGGFEQVGKIRGLGMEIGLSFIKDREKDSPDVDLAKKIVKKSKKRGIYILHGSSGNIQLMPPLVMERRDIDKGLDILITTIKKEITK